MSVSPNVIEIPALIPKKIKRRIVLTEEGINIEKPLSLKPGIFIPCENISSFRFGIECMHFLKMNFCRQYYLEIKDDQNKIFRIKLNSYYGIRNKDFFEVWADLLDKFWNSYMLNQLSFYIELFDIQQTFELAGVSIYPEGISWDDEPMLPWKEITVRSYQTHFVVHHVNDISQSKCCIFSVHWNAVVLQSLLKEIIKRPIKARKSSWL